MKKNATKTKNGTEPIRIGLNIPALKQAFLDNLACVQGKFPPIATKNDYYMSLAYTIRDRLMNRWDKTAQTYLSQAVRTICYFSAEYLIGPQLVNNVYNLEIYPAVSKAMHELGLDFTDLSREEVEPGLGNGGLGRLAACFMDSLATLNIPAIGYGIRYEFGIFNQEIQNGWQVENTDKWLLYGNPWEIPRPEISFEIKFGGYTKSYIDSNGSYQVEWVPNQVVKSVAYDMPIMGYKSNTANFLRLWKAEACESFNFQAFNVGDYYGAVNEKISSENITKILYPNDEQIGGRKLRLKQQYFFVASSLQDMIRIYKQRKPTLENFHKKYVIQLNDTHPAIAVSELMRIFIDEYHMPWDEAWQITQSVFCYTNHTLLSEALEKWPLNLFASVLPRHLEIIFELNHRFLDEVRQRFPGDDEKVKRMSLIEETGERFVRMANLACIGSHAINGVSELHTKLLKQEVLHDFYEMWPEKFSNKTNGATPRRFLLVMNPSLADLITKTIGDDWIKNLNALKRLEEFSDNPKFQKAWSNIKFGNKKDLAEIIYKRTGIIVDPESLFDIQVKRFHEYKRQHLNILHVVSLYNQLKRNPALKFTPRTIIFAGKAAPGYYMAKLMIKLINSVADIVNNDPYVKDQLKIVFLPNFNVKNSQYIYPAADLSEQISVAGKEASGTGNMKFAFNGALTIGTLDGANVEIREEVKEENFFLFGLKAEEVLNLRAKGYYPAEFINRDNELKEVLDLISSGYFSPREPKLFHPLIDHLWQRDEYFLCADYRSYVDCQKRVSDVYKDLAKWTKMSILNVARIGKFSSDRAILEYCNDIWKIRPVLID